VATERTRRDMGYSQVMIPSAVRTTGWLNTKFVGTKPSLQSGPTRVGGLHAKNLAPGVHPGKGRAAWTVALQGSIMPTNH
jgi:hypothetical protein